MSFISAATGLISDRVVTLVKPVISPWLQGQLGILSPPHGVCASPFIPELTRSRVGREWLGSGRKPSISGLSGSFRWRGRTRPPRSRPRSALLAFARPRILQPRRHRPGRAGRRALPTAYAQHPPAWPKGNTLLSLQGHFENLEERAHLEGQLGVCSSDRVGVENSLFPPFF